MQRRTLVRGLVGVTLAIAAGDLVALMARDAPSRPSPSRPPPAETLPPGVPRNTPWPDQLAERTASPPLPQAPQASARTLICRDAWGALPPTGPLAAHRIERLTIHHTAVVVTDPAGSPDRLRNYQRHHQRRGLTDLAYHFLIDRAGTLFEGRALSAVPGTFTRYDPTGHLTACLDGNFDEQSPSGPQLDALVDLLAWATEKFGLSPATIRGHRAYIATRCPGAALQALIADDTLRRRVDAVRARGRVELVPACGQGGTARVLLPGRRRWPGGGTAPL
ncbi:MAG: peptidoglycan recognition protein family protein [Actinomycetota bacterium]|nr:peptidoglycan recognition protein family protein [Actinomycetota bacterium]